MHSNTLVLHLYSVEQFLTHMEITAVTLGRNDGIFSTKKEIGENHFFHKILIEGLNYPNALKIAQEYLEDNHIEYDRKIFENKDDIVVYRCDSTMDESSKFENIMMLERK